MTEKNNLRTEQRPGVILLKPAIIGATVGLLLISIFVFGVDNPDPEWGEFWRIKPLILTPLAGAFAGALCGFIIYLGSRGSINKVVAFFLGVIVFAVVQWIGVVLGLNGTMWD